MITIPTTMTAEVIDPLKATQYLQVAAPNRQIRSGVVDQYARDMTAGHWATSVIRFGEDGQLWDGQHRLLAVVASDTTQQFWVERGVPLAATLSIDVGLKRTFGDILSIRGELSANILAASVRLARHLVIYPGRAPSGSSRYTPSRVEAIEFLDANPGIRDSVPMARRVTNALGFPASIATALHYLEAQRDKVKADEFWDQIENGDEQIKGTGPYALRQAIITDATHPIKRMDQNMGVAIAIKAWNAWEIGRPITQLRWQRNGGEAFPILGKPTRV